MRKIVLMRETRVEQGLRDTDMAPGDSPSNYFSESSTVNNEDTSAANNTRLPTKMKHGLVDNNNVIGTPERQREGMLLTDIEELEHKLFVANGRIHELEAQVSQREEEHNSSIARVMEQQHQLQEYLRAQLATYYDTIHGQMAQITDHTRRMGDMERRHEEATLIATRSVEASLRREESLLTNIAELEAELALSTRDAGEKEGMWMNMQSRIVELEDLLREGCAWEKSLVDRNEDLSMELIQRVREAN
jgi:hypothetical protein